MQGLARNVEIGSGHATDQPVKLKGEEVEKDNWAWLNQIELMG